VSVHPVMVMELCMRTALGSLALRSLQMAMSLV
jgi:hypothetical protein